MLAALGSFQVLGRNLEPTIGKQAADITRTLQNQPIVLIAGKNVTAKTNVTLFSYTLN
jgi:hypothetical protein